MLRWGWMVRAKHRPIYTRKMDPVPFVKAAGWPPGPVWTGETNIDSTWVRSLDCPSQSESLYRLHPPLWRTQIQLTQGRQTDSYWSSGKKQITFCVLRNANLKSCYGLVTRARLCWRCGAVITRLKTVLESTQSEYLHIHLIDCKWSSYWKY